MRTKAGAERHAQPDEHVFTTRTGRRLSPDAIQRRVTLHAEIAAARCSSLHGRKLTPHMLRHASAMTSCTQESTPA